MYSLKALNLSWRVDDRLFQLVAGELDGAKLIIDGEVRLTLWGDEWCTLSDALSRYYYRLPMRSLPPPEHDFGMPREFVQPQRTRKGKAWTEEEEGRLLAAYDAGDDAGVIAQTLDRSRAGVIARLVKLGRLAESEAGFRFPLQRGNVSDPPATESASDPASG